MVMATRSLLVRAAGALVFALALMAGVVGCEPPAQAQDADNCTPIQFARGATSASVNGRAPADGAVCYTLAVAEGQAASLRIDSRTGAAFSFVHSSGEPGWGQDAVDAFDFTTRAGTYTIYVFHLEPAPVSAPFTLHVSVAAGRALPPQSGGVSAGSAPVAAPSGAERQVTAWARERHGATLIEPVRAFYGDFTGDGAPDALVFAYAETGGAAVDLSVALFRNWQGRMVYWRDHNEVRGFEPRDVRFANGQVTVTTTVLRAGDPRCCPTGAQTWTIDAR